MFEHFEKIIKDSGALGGKCITVLLFHWCVCSGHVGLGVAAVVVVGGWERNINNFDGAQFLLCCSFLQEKRRGVLVLGSRRILQEAKVLKIKVSVFAILKVYNVAK